MLKEQQSQLVQKSQNKMLRMLNNSIISDQVSTKSMLEKFSMLSVNQMNAQISVNKYYYYNYYYYIHTLL